MRTSHNQKVKPQGTKMNSHKIDQNKYAFCDCSIFVSKKFLLFNKNLTRSRIMIGRYNEKTQIKGSEELFKGGGVAGILGEWN
jgi:hypothetical protein